MIDALRALLEEMEEIEMMRSIDFAGNQHDRGYREGYKDATTYYREALEEILDDSE